MRISIIGTAGRREDYDKLSKKLYINAVARLRAELLPYQEEELIGVSGGAAWADHMAISLFLLGVFSSLELHLPASWDQQKKQFIENKTDWRSSGNISNYYHRQFSKKMGKNTLLTLNSLQGNDKVVFFTGGGFKQRNTTVAEASDRMFALTFCNHPWPKVGSGTADTWKKASHLRVGEEKIHINLWDL